MPVGDGKARPVNGSDERVFPEGASVRSGAVDMVEEGTNREAEHLTDSFSKKQIGACQSKLSAVFT